MQPSITYTYSVHNHPSAIAALPLIFACKPLILLWSLPNRLHFLALPRLLLSLLLLISSGCSNEIQEVFVPEVLNYFTLFHFSLLLLSVSWNAISTLLHLSGCPDTLFCDQIALPSGLALFHLITYALAAAWSSLSHGIYPFLNSQLSLGFRGSQYFVENSFASKHLRTSYALLFGGY